MHPRFRRAVAVGAAAFCLALAVAQPAQAAGKAFPEHGRFDYQIGGAYTPAAGTAIVDRDNSAAPVAGLYNICYINAFQTQPGESGQWDQNLLLKNKSGAVLKDPDWPGEYILDTTTDANRKAIFAKLRTVLDSCVNKGFDAIEPDNLDTYTRDYIKNNAKVVPTLQNNVALLNMLGYYAHANGLQIAQKNTVEDTAYIQANAHTDFAIAEECQRYSECGTYTTTYGKKVIEIEYTDYAVSTFNAACTARGATASVIRRDRNVVAAGQSAYVYKLCSNG